MSQAPKNRRDSGVEGSPGMPPGLQFLSRLGESLVEQAPGLAAHFCLVISVPTRRLASTALSLGAFNPKWDCDGRCNHRVHSSNNERCATYLDGALQDVVAHRGDEGIRVGHQTIRQNSYGVHLLPKSFPTREAHPKGEDFLAEKADLALIHQLRPGLVRSEAGVHPVIVVGYGKGSVADARLPGSPLEAQHPLGVLAPGRFGNPAEPGWFRHPVLTAARLRESDDEGARWLSEVQPRLIIFVGLSTALDSSHNHWPHAPRVVVLSRRERNIDNIGEMEKAGWRRTQVPSSLSPMHGVETSAWMSVQSRSYNGLAEEEDDW
jgi:hypothetical protein